MKKDEVYIRHILGAIDAIEQYLKGVDLEKFLKNQLLQDGVIRELEIIGEASKKLSAKAKSRSKNTPWKNITGMRDKLIHEYFGVNLKMVWKTATRDIVSLKSELLDKFKEELSQEELDI